ncbi:FliG C-terminal domain-containing protein [Botrimarina hoheduenensis]|uniref:Flagellar motor switch protein FliG n=1 Tax=Botrimarina hoheduenensis TaxID=2528000 RepID=A0A5C5VZI4_9BACT|nr:FliG C-terminal domain-containing protein [Botrimarina hoheduenensis]TWT43181.1 Flagellar motor switch protein FliG [Botrimarina hoheduenensis]
MKPADSTPIRKAAVFFRSLAPEAAATMLSRLSPEEATRLRSAIRALGEIDPDEREAVAREVAEPAVSPQTKPAPSPTPQAKRSATEADGGVELMLSGIAMASETAPTTPRRPSVPAPINEQEDPWLDSLNEAEPEAIAGFLSREQPQAVALVLSRLPDALAAAVLAQFEPARRGAVLRQLSRTGEADPSTLRVIATELANWIQQHRHTRQQRAERLAKVEAIVGALPVADRAGIVEQLAENDEELATLLSRFAAPTPIVTPTDLPSSSEIDRQTPPPQPVEPQHVVFARLVRVDPRRLLEGVRRLPPRVALLALVELPEPVLRAVKKQLPRSAARDLSQRLAAITPVRLRDVEASQRALDARLRSLRSGTPSPSTR